MEKTTGKGINLIFQSAEGKAIEDWSQLPGDVMIPAQTYAGMGMNDVSPKYMGLYRTQGREYHTSGIVGVGWLKDGDGHIVTDPVTGQECAIMIKPRFQSMDPWRMLSKVLADDEYEEYVAECGPFYSFDTTQKLIPVPAAEKGGELLAVLSFLKACERICRRNITRRMSFEENNFNGRVVGNIQVQKQLKHNVVMGREDRIYCRYPVFTVDTLENRILKSALGRAHTILQENHNRSTEIQRIYSYCASALKMVSGVRIQRSDFNRIKTTGCNSHYKGVMKLAQIILFHEGVADLHNEHAEGMRMVIPYTINMERLFEFYVRSIIKGYFKEHSGEGSRFHLDEYRRRGVNSLKILAEGADPRGIYLMEGYIPDIAIYEDVLPKEESRDENASGASAFEDAAAGRTEGLEGAAAGSAEALEDAAAGSAEALEDAAAGSAEALEGAAAGRTEGLDGAATEREEGSAEKKRRYVAVFDVKYQHSTAKAYEGTVRHNSHQLLFYMLMLNVKSCGFIFPKEKGGIEFNEGVPLRIQDGNRVTDISQGEAFYTQWLIDLEQENQGGGFAEKMIKYLEMSR